MTRDGPRSGDPHHSASSDDGVPAGASNFVGRTRELAEMSRLLDTSRLVTLTGVAGIGKSRLALELGTQCRRRFRDGAWFVDLTQLSGPSLVPPAVAAALGLAEQGGPTVTEALITRLADRHLLLVLDACEPLGKACAELAERLLADCPGLSVLATSREPLGVCREVTWRVPTLELPGPGDTTPEDMLRSEAVRLFVVQSRAIQPDFALTPETAGVVAEICRRLDGIPLAIELAAAHITESSPDEIASLLDDQWRLHSRHGPGSVPRRHHTTTVALEWSYGLLSDPQRALLRRLSLFPGGCSLDAAQHACSGEDIAAADVPDLLAGLAASSLVIVERTRDRTRYRLLNVVRTYARHELDDVGETRTYQARHAEWCLELSESAEPELTGSQHRACRERLDAERANLRAAIEWALAEREGELALRMTAALTQFWRASGHFSEGCDLLERALAVGGDEPAPLRAKALWGLGFLGSLAGAYDRALPAAEECLALSRELGDTRGAGRAMYVVGFIRSFAGDAPAAISNLRDAVILARQEGDGWCVSRALAAGGRAHLLRGEVAQAVPWLEESLRVARDAGDEQGTTNGLIGLGWAALAQDRHASAETSLSEALDLATALADRFAIGVAISLLGELARQRGAHEEARALLRHSLSLGRTVGSPIPVVLSLRSLGGVAHAEGDAAEAWELLDEAVSMSNRLPAGAADRFGRLAEVAAAGGDRVATTAHFEAALEVARANDDHHAAGYAAYQLGTIARLNGDRTAALSLHQEALRLRSQCRDQPGMADSLEALAGLAIDRGDAATAARLFGAAWSIRQGSGHPRPPGQGHGYDADLAAAREQLSRDDFDAAWSEGAAQAPQQAVDYVVRSRGTRRRSVIGWASLTPSQEQTALLAGQGLTNQEIGERLFISPRTVQTHLSQVYAKLGLSSRQELAWALARRELRDDG
jgi:predicted ATPase/DNA-binding CsgD family transcriptional regulator